MLNLWCYHFYPYPNFWATFGATNSVDATWPQRKRTTKKHSLKERSGEGDVVSGIQVQLEENESGNIGQSWFMFHRELQGLKSHLRFIWVCTQLTSLHKELKK